MKGEDLEIGLGLHYFASKGGFHTDVVVVNNTLIR